MKTVCQWLCAVVSPYKRGKDKGGVKNKPESPLNPIQHLGQFAVFISNNVTCIVRA